MTTIDDSTAVALGVTSFLLIVVLYLWTALGLSAVFRKSGEQGWKGWVPFLNQVVLLQLGGLSGWLLLLLLIPGIGPLVLWVFLIVACYRINVAFGHGVGMTVLAAILFPVWASILGFGPARWLGTAANPRHAAGGPRRTAVFADAAAEYVPRATPPAYTPSPTFSTSPPPSPIVPAPAGDARSVVGVAPAPAVGGPSSAVPVPPIPPMPPLPTAASTVDFEPDSAVIESAVTDSAVTDSADTGSGEPGVFVGRSGFAPAPAADADRWGGFDLGAISEVTSEVTGAEAGAPAPISAVPIRATTDAPPVASAPAVTRVPVAPRPAEEEPWAPARSPMSDGDAFPETSGQVSAIAGAPDAGTPRSARGAVSAQHTKAEIPEDPLDQTIITRRRRTPWSLVPPSGVPLAITADVVLLGRKPVADAGYPGAQLVAIDDGTVSKTHARLELREERWHVTDLGSTNGVLFATMMGTEVEAPPGVEVEAGERFFLGDAEVRLQRSDG